MSSRGFTRTRVAGVVVTAAALVALAVGVAGAHKVSYRTNTTFNAVQGKGVPGQTQRPANVYSGKVTSPDHEMRCVRERVVTVTHQGFVLGTDTTTDGGRWEIVEGPPFPPEGDELVATVRRKQSGKRPKHKHVCQRAAATAKAP